MKNQYGKIIHSKTKDFSVQYLRQGDGKEFLIVSSRYPEVLVPLPLVKKALEDEWATEPTARVIKDAQ